MTGNIIAVNSASNNLEDIQENGNHTDSDNGEAAAGPGMPAASNSGPPDHNLRYQLQNQQSFNLTRPHRLRRQVTSKKKKGVEMSENLIKYSISFGGYPPLRLACCTWRLCVYSKKAWYKGRRPDWKKCLSSYAIRKYFFSPIAKKADNCRYSQSAVNFIYLCLTCISLTHLRLSVRAL